MSAADGSPLSILQGVSLRVEEGASLAITGASGSGKTTLLSLLAGLDTPTHGSVRLCGHDLGSLGDAERSQVRRDNLGFVFQSFHLLGALTALENVMLPLEVMGGRGRDIRERAAQMLDEVGLAQRLHAFPATLSGGEQQRVAIARAFAQQPRVLFADEPTGNLDTATGAKIADLLFALNGERRVTLVLVTHAAALAQRCARQVRLDAGRLVD